MCTHSHVLFYSYSKCDEYIQNFKEGKLRTQPGCTAEETLEVCEQVVKRTPAKLHANMPTYQLIAFTGPSSHLGKVEPCLDSFELGVHGSPSQEGYRECT